MITAEQQLASKYGIMIKRNKGGVLLAHGWSEQNGGEYAPCSPPDGSEMASLIERALAERAAKPI